MEYVIVNKDSMAMHAMNAILTITTTPTVFTVRMMLAVTVDAQKLELAFVIRAGRVPHAMCVLQTIMEQHFGTYVPTVNPTQHATDAVSVIPTMGVVFAMLV